MGTQLPLPQTGTPPFRPMSIVATVAHLSYCSALVQIGCPGPLFGGRLQLPHICSWPNGGALDNAGCYFLQCGGVVAAVQWECSVKNFTSQLCTYVGMSSWAILSRTDQKGGVSYGTKRFTKVQRDDIDYTEACLIVMVCSRDAFRTFISTRIS